MRFTNAFTRTSHAPANIYSSTNCETEAERSAPTSFRDTSIRPARNSQNGPSRRHESRKSPTQGAPNAPHNNSQESSKRTTTCAFKEPLGQPADHLTALAVDSYHLKHTATMPQVGLFQYHKRHTADMLEVILLRCHLRHIAHMSQMVRGRYHLMHTNDMPQVVLVQYNLEHTTAMLPVVLLRYHLNHISDMTQMVLLCPP